MSFTLRQMIDSVNDRLSGQTVPHADDAHKLREQNLAKEEKKHEERQATLRRQADERARLECRKKIWAAIRARQYSWPIRCAPIEPHPYHRGHLGQEFANSLRSKNYVLEQVVHEEVGDFERCYQERDAFTLVKFK